MAVVSDALNWYVDPHLAAAAVVVMEVLDTVVAYEM
jgi:hypothetical protein